jgi:hypothetical protein
MIVDFSVELSSWTTRANVVNFAWQETSLSWCTITASAALAPVLAAPRVPPAATDLTWQALFPQWTDLSVLPGIARDLSPRATVYSLIALFRAADWDDEITTLSDETTPAPDAGDFLPPNVRAIINTIYEPSGERPPDNAAVLTGGPYVIDWQSGDQPVGIGFDTFAPDTGAVGWPADLAPYDTIGAWVFLAFQNGEGLATDLSAPAPPPRLTLTRSYNIVPLPGKKNPTIVVGTQTSGLIA